MSTEETLPKRRSYYRDLFPPQATSQQPESSPSEGEFVGLVYTGDKTATLYGATLKCLFTTTPKLPPEPNSMKEALEGPFADEWKAAMDVEMAALIGRGTWQLEELPKGQRLVGVKWIFKIKTQADGSLDKFKARLVARGFSQIEGKDFFKTFAPVTDYTTARIFLAITAVNKLALVQLDVKNAFLYGAMDADVYMKQPDGYTDGTYKVCKLIKSLYGLKQSPRMWYLKLEEALNKQLFSKSTSDEALFIKKEGGAVYCLVYVDDILMASGNRQLLNQEVTTLQKTLNF